MTVFQVEFENKKVIVGSCTCANNNTSIMYILVRSYQLVRKNALKVLKSLNLGSKSLPFVQFKKGFETTTAPGDN